MFRRRLRQRPVFLWLGIYGWLADEAVVQLIEEEDQDGQDNDGCQETYAGIAAFTEVQGNVVLGIAPDRTSGFLKR